MQSNETAEIVIDLAPETPLAEVIQVPQEEPASFYTRNSGSLPRLDGSAPGRYHRAQLPTPVAPEPDTVMNRFKEFISRNRPAWIPQR
jgi:hypothetical protein